MTIDAAAIAKQQLWDRLQRGHFRFAVHNAADRYTTCWMAFGQGNDYYIGSRSFFGSQKISLHGSGHCRVAFTEPQMSKIAEDGVEPPSDRAITKWRRNDIPDGGASHVVSLVFPTRFMTQDAPVGSEKKPVFHFAVGPDWEAVEFGFFYWRPPNNAVEERFRKIGKYLCTTHLVGGESVAVVAREAKFDEASLPTAPLQTSMNKMRREVFPAGVNEITNLTTVLWNTPERGSLRVIEIGGVTIRKNQSPPG